MAKPTEEKFQRSRVRGSYISVILSVSLVLFTLGLLGLVLLYGQKLSNQIKENIGFTVFLADDVKEIDIQRLQKAIDLAPYTAKSTFISKEAAVELLKEDLGEDFLQYLDYNPLLASIEVKLNPVYAHPDSLAIIQSQLSRSSKIKEVAYEESLVSMVQRNIRRIGIMMLAFSSLLLIVAIALINNSIRLSIYSKRFLIKSMQLVGATQGFIRRPFVQRGILHGVFSSLIAILLIIGVLYYLERILPELIQVEDVSLLIYLFLVVLALGILISWISTSLAVRKFIRTRSDKLH